ncbi:eRF1 domain 1-domain-containing protein [Pisolithus orientalis]|uniref:eRF1 domain 1-domain-containing protein n=1 Tax=Pisolithus orientalis TaxID=936130 RepID=UPI002224D170|nr:eRF1 domain 1-domain-containing protein [Pisolithus orientalis]KAI6035140.1 eRF1 domain 1-domain-containing protein [Pisolithus orientalis]
MKLVGKYIDKRNGSGYVTLRPEDNEDIWHLYNLIQQDNLVKAPAVRRVQNVSATGSTESHRVKLNLKIQVSKVEYSSSGGAQSSSSDQANQGSSSTPSMQSTAVLHISGKVVSENQYVRLGAFHTLDIEVNRDIRVEKSEGWDSIALARVEESCIPGRGAEVGAVVCGEGSAAFCLLSQHLTLVTHRISTSIPRKASAPGSSQYEKAMTKFYSMVYDAFVRHIPFGNPSLRAIVFASPGWVRESVYTWMTNEASRRGDKLLAKSLREKTVKVHVSSPHVHSLIEVLKSPEIVAQLKETKFAREGIVLDKFFKMLASDEMRAWYGPDHVCLAADRGAIGTLLISDELFRSSDPKTRKKFVSLVENVQHKGGEVQIFSSMHESGQQLNQLTGIAAILTFPLDVEVVEAEEREAAEEAEKNKEEGGEVKLR